jgi:formylglycine-generating enzyme required for sulfatase activity
MKRKYITTTLLLIGFLCGNLMTYANNITVTNCTLTGQNTSAGVNNVANFSLVQFDLRWENSWRVNVGQANWDAAWVFVKFRVGASNPTFTSVSSTGTTITVSSTTNLRVGMPLRVTSGTGVFAANTVITSITSATQFVVSIAPTTALNNASIECIRIWEHARLNNTGHTAPAGSTIDAGLLTPGTAFDATTNPALGVFIYRDAQGIGTNTFNNTQLRWNYGANGLNDNVVISVQVFAVEMVYVPGGVDFNVGGGGGTAAFTSTTINTGNATTVPSGTGSLGGQAGGYPTGQTAPTSASWPNGYNAFFCMKYEASQGQYRDFLNTLTYAQQVNRTAVVPTSVAGTGALSSTNANRNGIDIQTPGNATTLLPAVYGCNLNGNTTYNEAADGEWIACNFLSWMDDCAYMDWAGLRPMTELEFEKACRGNQPSVSGEYAWGTNTINAFTTSTLINSGSNVEIPNTQSTTIGNANFSNSQTNIIQGPLRVGIFATASTTRVTSGATYYGIMEMSGNLWELIVTIGNLAGRSYTAVHGDGNLFRDGTANVDFWPGINGNATVNIANTAFIGTTGVTQTAGSGFRGGDWGSAPAVSLVSQRAAGVWSLTNQNVSSLGLRGVRTAQ